MTMQLTVDQQGDLARLREMRMHLTKALLVTSADGALGTCLDQEVDALQANLIRAFVCLGNLLSRLGDHSVMEHADLTIPRQQIRFQEANHERQPQAGEAR